MDVSGGYGVDVGRCIPSPPYTYPRPIGPVGPCAGVQGALGIMGWVYAWAWVTAQVPAPITQTHAYPVIAPAWWVGQGLYYAGTLHTLCQPQYPTFNQLKLLTERKAQHRL